MSGVRRDSDDRSRTGSVKRIAMEATPPQEDLTLSGRALFLLFLGQCALDRMLAPYFTSGDDGWDRNDVTAGGNCGGGGGGDGEGGSCANGNTINSRDVAIFTGALFVCATAISLLNAIWTPSSTRSQLYQTAAYVTVGASYTYLQMARGGDWFIVGHDGTTRHSGLRLLEWLFSNPVMMILVKQMHRYSVLPPNNTDSIRYVKAVMRITKNVGSKGGAHAYKPPSAGSLVRVHLTMLAFGCAGGMLRLPAFARAPALAASVALLVFLLFHIVRCLMSAAKGVGVVTDTQPFRLYSVAAFNVVAWIVYPLISGARELKIIGVDGMNLGYAVGDGMAKLSLCMVYVASCTRILDQVDNLTQMETEDVLADQRRFFHHISTELRQPLSSILGFSNLALEHPGEVPSEVKDFQRAIIASAESMNALIKQSVDYATIQRHMRGKKTAGLPLRSGAYDAAQVPLPPMWPTPYARRCSVSDGPDYPPGLAGVDEDARLSTIFTPVKLIDLVMAGPPWFLSARVRYAQQAAAEVLPEGFEIVPDIHPRGAAHTEHLKANASRLRDSLVVLIRSACVQKGLGRKEVKKMVAEGKPPCVKLRMEVGPPRGSAELGISVHGSRGARGGGGKRGEEKPEGERGGGEGVGGVEDVPLEWLEAAFMIFVTGEVTEERAADVVGESGDGGRGATTGRAASGEPPERKSLHAMTERSSITVKRSSRGSCDFLSALEDAEEDVIDQRHRSTASSSINAERYATGDDEGTTRLSLTLTVTKAVIEAMGGELTYAPPPEDDTFGDVFAFSVPLLRSPVDESSFDFEFIPSLPTPTYARVAAVLHPSLSASYKGYAADMLRGYDITTIATPATEDELLNVWRGFDKNNGAAAAGAGSHAQSHVQGHGRGGVDTVLPVLMMPADGERSRVAGLISLVATAGELGCAVLVGSSLKAATETTAALKRHAQSCGTTATRVRNVAVVPQPTTSAEMHRALCSVVAHCGRVLGGQRSANGSAASGMSLTSDGGGGANDAHPGDHHHHYRSRRVSKQGTFEPEHTDAGGEQTVHRPKSSRSITAYSASDDTSSNTDNEWFKSLGDSLTTTTTTTTAAATATTSTLTTASGSGLKPLDVGDSTKETAAAPSIASEQEGVLLPAADSAANNGGGGGGGGGGTNVSASVPPALTPGGGAQLPSAGTDARRAPDDDAEGPGVESPPVSAVSAGRKESGGTAAASSGGKKKVGLKENELQGLDILVVEDNHFQLRIVRATLQGSGVSMEVALHGQEAVDAVTKRIERGEKLYDLIFMDSMMPVMDGATATREIRRVERAHRDAMTPAEIAEKCPETMIIVGLSAEAGADYEREAREVGMDGALGKPCRPDTMRETLKAVLAKTWKRGSFKIRSKRANLHF